jgi:membrane protease YdiL (CAAX protease family)
MIGDKNLKYRKTFMIFKRQHSIIDIESKAPQPPLYILIAFILLYGDIMKFFWKFLNLISTQFSIITDPPSPILRITYFCFSLIFIFSVIIFCSKKYKSALYSGLKCNFKSISAIVVGGIICSIPLFLYYRYNFIIFAKFITNLAELTPSKTILNSSIKNLMDEAWLPLGYGTDICSIYLASANCFLMPILEECLIIGFLYNYLHKKFRPICSVLLIAFIFALLHIHITGLNMKFVYMFLFGLTSIGARYITGSWLGGLISHWVINFMIFLPKWFVVFAALKLEII